MFLAGIASGPFASRFGSKAVVVCGTIISVLAFLLLTFARTTVWQVCTATAVMGLGLGLSFAALSSVIVGAVPAGQSGVASGMNANIRTIGGAIGAALMASIVTAGTPPGGTPHESGYTFGFGMLAAASVLAFLAALVIPAALPKREIPGSPRGSR